MGASGTMWLCCWSGGVYPLPHPFPCLEPETGLASSKLAAPCARWARGGKSCYPECPPHHDCHVPPIFSSPQKNNPSPQVPIPSPVFLMDNGGVAERRGPGGVTFPGWLWKDRTRMAFSLAPSFAGFPCWVLAIILLSVHLEMLISE